MESGETESAISNDKLGEELSPRSRRIRGQDGREVNARKKKERERMSESASARKLLDTKATH